MNFNQNTLAAKLIAESDLKAERLISVLRMILATMLFLGVAFVLSQSQSAGLGARRFELLSLLAGAACYFLLGAINFYVAKEGRLKPWMSWAFNIGEVTIVSIQLYIDVADAATPSLLAFASPVILVAALVICVQVLRYQIKLHIFSALLLLGLCALILFYDPQSGKQLSVQSAQELQLLYTVPPNIVRIVMLAAMAVLIGLAVYRSRRLVETVARETEVAENRKRFLPSEISDQMSDESLHELRLGEDRDLSVLIVDIRDFTRTAEAIGPRETATLLSTYRTLITDAVISHDGVIDKFIGDGALVVFGLHSDIEKACLDAINAARDIQTAVNRWNETRPAKKLKIVIGVHAGPAVIGAIGDDRRLEFTAIGNTINLASRIEEIAKEKDWKLAISRPAADMAEIDTAEFSSSGPTFIRGSNEPLEVLGQS